MTSHLQMAPPRPLPNKVPQITVYSGSSGAVHDGRGDGRRLSQCQPEPGVDRDIGDHRCAAGRGDGDAVCGGPLYVGGRYWTAVTLVNVFGILITDNLTDALGVPLEVSTVGVRCLAGRGIRVLVCGRGNVVDPFVLTPRREGFYWAAILLTFALGTRPVMRGDRRTQHPA
jgi:hypothetical protein